MSGLDLPRSCMVSFGRDVCKTLDFKKNPCTFTLPLKFLTNVHYQLNQSLFACNFHLLLSTYKQQVYIALDVIGRWVVQLFYHANAGRFFLQLLLNAVGEKQATFLLHQLGEATYSTNKKKVQDENRFWLIRKFWKAAGGNYKSDSVNTICLPKKRRIDKRIVYSP